jgi:hypothetical protein
MFIVALPIHSSVECKNRASEQKIPDLATVPNIIQFFSSNILHDWERLAVDKATIEDKNKLKKFIRFHGCLQALEQ